MDPKALFKVSCGLVITGVALEDKVNACITNTLMQQSHVPVKFSLTVEKTHLTHDMIMKKRNVAISITSINVSENLIRRFGFVSGRVKDKFEGIPYITDINGNPLIESDEIAAHVSLSVYNTVDVGTHTLFLCTVDDIKNLDFEAITYSQYRKALLDKLTI